MEKIWQNNIRTGYERISKVNKKNRNNKKRKKEKLGEFFWGNGKIIIEVSGI